LTFLLFKVKGRRTSLPLNIGVGEGGEMVGKKRWNVTGRTWDLTAGVRYFGIVLRVKELVIQTTDARTFWRKHDCSQKVKGISARMDFDSETDTNWNNTYEIA
jgi:hypothetical protein